MVREEEKEKLLPEVGGWGVESVLEFCGLQQRGEEKADVSACITAGEMSGEWSTPSLTLEYKYLSWANQQIR